MTETREREDAKRAIEKECDPAAIRAEAARYACQACKGHGKRIVPNKRERGIPPQDFGPGFYGTCPDCNGTGRRHAP
jgi:DnaJ-class molecular chaperone